VYEAAPGTLSSLVTMPEWYLVTAALFALSLLGFLWTPLFAVAPLFVLAVGASVAQAIRGASHAVFPTPVSSRWALTQRYALTAALHFLQPIARLRGRMQWGLSPWRHSSAGFLMPRVRVESVWTENWRDSASWLSEIESAIRLRGATVLRGGDFDRWDLELRRGLFASTKLMLAVEEHGGGRQLARIKMWPRFSRVAGIVASLSIVLALLAFDAREYVPAILFAGVFAAIAIRTLQECASTMHDVAKHVRALAAPAQSAA